MTYRELGRLIESMTEEQKDKSVKFYSDMDGTLQPTTETGYPDIVAEIKLVPADEVMFCNYDWDQLVIAPVIF